MSKIFDRIKIRAPRLNKFDLSHERKMSISMDALYPVLVQDVVPGDKFRVSSEVMMRLAPMLAPVMHRVNVFVHYFFVPNRLVWSEWDDFITGGRLGTSEPVHPYILSADDLIAAGALDNGSLWDMMGIRTVPVGAAAQTNALKVSALPFRAYQLIYDEFYRDQNLQASLDISTASGQVTGAELTKILTRRTRCWEKDYFTSALPWAQRGAEVTIPMDYLDESIVVDSATGLPHTTATTIGPDGTAGGVLEAKDGANPSVRIENIAGLASVNELRRSIRIQEWLEKNARAGGRYVEQLLAHFGVLSPDARMQRPEYLGGGKQPIVMSEVLSTYQDPAGAGEPQANMAGRGFSLGRSNQFQRRFVEHGYVIGLISVLPKTAYQQGCPRHLTKFDKFDYAWPELANIGEQDIKLKEIWWNHAGTNGSTEWTFGYQSRYAEYKYACDSVHGDFRDDLSFWHMGRIFTAFPELNESFVRANSTHRIFAVDDPLVEKLYCQVYNRVDALRPLPYFGTPTL